MLKLWNVNRDHLTLDKIRKQYLPLIDEVYRTLHGLSDAELEEASVQLAEEVKKVNSHSMLRIQAFALVKEAARRAHGIEMFDEQLIGGWVLCDGMIADMKTGEGKTILSLLPAFWFALQQRGVHVITVNEYLARRDYEQMKQVFQLLQLTVGLNLAEMSPQAKKVAYQQSVTFGTSSEFGFDYLRDNLVLDKANKVKGELVFAILDEVDHILIDEARTPLIIAAKTKAAPDLYHICTRYIDRLQQERDYELDSETRQVMFTGEGIQRLEATFLIDNLYNLDHTTVYHYMLQSLRAKALFHRDIDYIVSDSKVILIDVSTGRMMEGRQYNEGLHQAIEAKEKVPLSEEIHTNGMITIQKYFSLYGTKVGMSGTVKSIEAEMKRIYQLQVIEIPTHKPMIRVDQLTCVYKTKEEKFTNIIIEIQQRYSLGQPLLIGTTSVRQSEEIANRLAEIGLPYRLLNAKTEQEENEIIAAAGQRNSITIATNMAGRGTDIRLAPGVAELGGLYVMGTELHESRRIDNQLRGRAGRQGDQGTSRFFISLEDDLFGRFSADDVIDCYVESDKKRLAFTEHVQKRLEQQMFEIRSLVFQMDSIIHEQRQAYYLQRNLIVEEEVTVMDALSEQMNHFLADIVNNCCPEPLVHEEWNLTKLAKALEMNAECLINLHTISDNQMMLQKVKIWWDDCCDRFLELLNMQDEQELTHWINRWKRQMLLIMDHAWQRHLDHLEQIKMGIHYQALGQRSPILAYEEETWKRFTEMSVHIRQQMGGLLIKEVAEKTKNIK